MTKLLLFVVAIVSLSYAMISLVRGKVWGHGYRKGDFGLWGRTIDPLYFWINIALYLTIGAILFYKFWTWEI